MKVDFDTWQGQQLYEAELQALEEKRDFGLIEMLKPDFCMDGNMYCFTYPSIEGLPNDCVQGFGETASKAARDFRDNWYQRNAL